MNKKRITQIIIALVILAGIYYFVFPLFDAQRVDDPVPGSIDHLSGEEQRDMMRQLIEANKEEMPEMEEQMPQTRAQVSAAFPIQDTPLHPASGSARVISTDEETVIRFENFETINGPKVHVYLASDTSATDFIDLGPIRGTEGNINYTVPEGVDLDDYPIVMHWCVPFGVLFNYAEIR